MSAEISFPFHLKITRHPLYLHMAALSLKGSVLVLDDLLYIVEIFSLTLPAIDLGQRLESVLADRVQKWFIRRVFIYDD